MLLSLYTTMAPAKVIGNLHGKVSYSGRRHKAVTPRNLQEKIAEYLHESFLEISQKD